MSPWQKIRNQTLRDPDKPFQDTDAILGDALQRRYKTKDDILLADRLMRDMGMEGYNLEMNLDSKIQPLTKEGFTYGFFEPGKNQMYVNKRIPKGAPDRAATIYHELGHMGDQIVDPAYLYRDTSRPGDSHFKFYPEEQEGLLKSLEAQYMIEKGGMPSPQVMENMPWLKQVAPNSSNMLANPWRSLLKKGVSKESWNN